MKIKLVDHTENPEDKIAMYAAICYNSKTDEASNERRIKHLMDVKHLATLRFAYATFLVSGVSRACTHQLVRHPHLSYLQESQRYVKQSNTMFTIPTGMDSHQRSIVATIFNDLLRAYNDLIQLGVKKEDARYVLPEATHSQMYITGNFQAWFDFLKNRLESHAQWEIRAVAEVIHKDLLSIAPNVFKGINNDSDKYD